MSIVIVPTMFVSIFESQFLSNEKSKIVLIAGIIYTVILVSGMIILGLNFGIMGLAFSFVIATVAKAIFFVWVYYKNNEFSRMIN